MNFSPFGGHFPASIPTIHQFAAKFGHHDGTTGGLCPPSQESASSAVGRYPTNTSVPSFTQHHPPPQQHIMPPTKYQGATTGYINQQYQHQTGIGRLDKRQGYDQQQELAQELCAAMLHGGQQQLEHKNQQQQQQQTQNNEKIKQEREQDDRHQHQQQNNHQTNTPTSMPSTWQSLAAPGSTVADYLSHLPASTLPISLHHFLKYSAENIKKESVQQLNINNLTTPDPNLNSINHNNQPTTTPAPTKKKKKKKAAKEKKPRPKPGEIRLTTALDGSTLYCCPECHMAYPEKELLEQHLVGHTLERRFVCDICGAGLKRKDHLTRHKQSHNPERPYVCTVCLKAFKRKEQLTLHFVIHSGEKRHICPECGKGFYRKDHLRKHTRSHIARRVKAELSQQGNTASGLQVPVAAPGPPATAVAQALLS